jgi:hypothetical protein
LPTAAGVVSSGLAQCDARRADSRGHGAGDTKTSSPPSPAVGPWLLPAGEPALKALDAFILSPGGDALVDVEEYRERPMS